MSWADNHGKNVTVWGVEYLVSESERKTLDKIAQQADRAVGVPTAREIREVQDRKGCLGQLFGLE